MFLRDRPFRSSAFFWSAFY